MQPARGPQGGNRASLGSKCSRWRGQARPSHQQSFGEGVSFLQMSPEVPDTYVLVQTATKRLMPCHPPGPQLLAKGSSGLESPPLMCSQGSAGARLWWVRKAVACVSVPALHTVSCLATPPLCPVSSDTLLATRRPLFPASCVILSFLCSRTQSLF